MSKKILQLISGTVVDGNIVSGRRPPDLPAYAKAFIEVVKARG